MRVSSVDQHPETQLHDLRQMATQRGYQIAELWKEFGNSPVLRCGIK